MLPGTRFSYLLINVPPSGRTAVQSTFLSDSSSTATIHGPRTTLCGLVRTRRDTESRKSRGRRERRRKERPTSSRECLRGTQGSDSLFHGLDVVAFVDTDCCPGNQIKYSDSGHFAPEISASFVLRVGCSCGASHPRCGLLSQHPPSSRECKVVRHATPFAGFIDMSNQSVVLSTASVQF